MTNNLQRQELLKILKLFPSGTKIYGINGREIKLAGDVNLDAHDCADEWGNSIFRQTGVEGIRNTGELIYYIERSHFHNRFFKNRIEKYIHPITISNYIDKTADLSPDKDLFLWQWGQRMNQGELREAVEFAEKMRKEDKKTGNRIEQDLLKDNDDIEELGQQIDILERALQSNQSEIRYLEWRLEQIGRGKANDIWDLEKEVQSKKSSREWEIIKLERQINEKQKKLNFLKRNKNLSLITSQKEEVKKLKEDNSNLRQQLLKVKKDLLNFLKIDAKNRLETDSQKSFLDMLLSAQEQLVFLENSSQLVRSSSERELEKAKNFLKEKLTNEEISNFCQLQKEIADLEKFQEAHIEIVNIK